MAVTHAAAVALIGAVLAVYVYNLQQLGEDPTSATATPWPDP